MLKLLAKELVDGEVVWTGKMRTGRLRHFVSFLCFADKRSRAYAAGHPHTHAESYSEESLYPVQLHLAPIPTPFWQSTHIGS